MDEEEDAEGMDVDAEGMDVEPGVVDVDVEEFTSFTNSWNLLTFQVSIGVQYQLNHHWIIFYCSFCLEVINQIPIPTNLYHDQVNQEKKPKTNWIPVTMQEIKTFLDINIAMGIVNLPETKSYWAKGIIRIPWFLSIMSRSRLEQICQYLHLADKDSKEYKLYKLGKIDEKLNEAATTYYKPKQSMKKSLLQSLHIISAIFSKERSFE